jgi:hypothetical protein
MHRIGLVLLAIALPAFAQNDDITAARAVFDANVNAIRQKNREAYLSYYLHSPLLVRGGPTGFTTGYDEFAKAAGAWPDSIDASDIHLTSLHPGVVYARIAIASVTPAATSIPEFGTIFVKTSTTDGRSRSARSTPARHARLRRARSSVAR